MKIDLKISTNRISEARFWTDGCGASISCGSKLTKMIKGKTLQETKNFTSTNLLDSLGGLPSENRHCAVLAVDTLKACIKKYNLEKRKK